MCVLGLSRWRPWAVGRALALGRRPDGKQALERQERGHGDAVRQEDDADEQERHDVEGVEASR